jgi:hypothetical protein
MRPVCLAFWQPASLAGLLRELCPAAAFLCGVLLRERFEKARDEVLDQVAGAKSSPDAVRLAHELTKKQLDIALDSMKQGARQTRSEESLEDEYRRFLENL